MGVMALVSQGVCGVTRLDCEVVTRKALVGLEISSVDRIILVIWTCGVYE